MTHITFPDMIDIPDWTRTYCNKVYDTLSGIIAEHGARGWKQARWMVYDRVRILFAVISWVRSDAVGCSMRNVIWDALSTRRFEVTTYGAMRVSCSCTRASMKRWMRIRRQLFSGHSGV